MHPLLFNLGPVTIHTYGFFVVLGVGLGIWLSLRAARRYGLDPGALEDLLFYLIVAGVVGSRLWFVAASWPHFQDRPWDILKFWQGGLVFYGALLTGIPVTIYFMARKKMPIFATGDALAPGLAVGQALGRLGCLSAGCCYGRPTDLPWGITFTDGQCLAPLHEALHPTQLYSFFTLMAIFGVLLWIQGHRRIPGQVFWTYGLLHGLTRPILELFRADDRGPALIGDLTSSQVASLVLAAVSAGILIYLRKQGRLAAAPARGA